MHFSRRRELAGSPWRIQPAACTHSPRPGPAHPTRHGEGLGAPPMSTRPALPATAGGGCSDPIGGAGARAVCCPASGSGAAHRQAPTGSRGPSGCHRIPEKDSDGSFGGMRGCPGNVLKRSMDGGGIKPCPLNGSRPIPLPYPAVVARVLGGTAGGHQWYLPSGGDASRPAGPMASSGGPGGDAGLVAVVPIVVGKWTTLLVVSTSWTGGWSAATRGFALPVVGLGPRWSGWPGWGPVGCADGEGGSPPAGRNAAWHCHRW